MSSDNLREEIDRLDDQISQLKKLLEEARGYIDYDLGKDLIARIDAALKE